MNNPEKEKRKELVDLRKGLRSWFSNRKDSVRQKSANEKRLYRHNCHVGKKKNELGVEGDLRNRHLLAEQRKQLTDLVKWAIDEGPTLSVTDACKFLEINSRTYYRWIKEPLSNRSGGGGKNKIIHLEEKRIVAIAKKMPEWHCRKIAYQLEKLAYAFIG